MNQIRIALVLVLLLGSAAFSRAQDDPKPPKPEQSQQDRDMAPPHQEEAKPAKPEKQEKQENAKPQKDEARPAHGQDQKMQQGNAREGNAQEGNAQQGHARPAGKSAHIPDQKFKASFGHQHTFAAKQVIQNTTVVVGQTQFVYSGFTFVFLDPWPSEWLFTDDCYIDYVDGEYFLLDAVHPGIRVAVFVQG